MKRPEDISPIPPDGSQRQTDLVVWRDIEPADTKTLIEMYAYKYTKGIRLDDRGFDYVTAEHRNSEGEICQITVPLEDGDRRIPLQMRFQLRRGAFLRFFTYPGDVVYSDDRTDNEPDKTWLNMLEEFFGPVGLGGGLKSQYETQGYRSSLSEPYQSLSSFGYDSGYGMGKSIMSAPKFYPGYKHNVYGKLFSESQSGGRKAAASDSPKDQTETEASHIADRHTAALSNLPRELILKAITIILSARKKGLSDRGIFYALAREFHPDTSLLPGSGAESVMKILNVLYDKEKREFFLEDNKKSR